MAHWRALYGADILDFDYDTFVRDPNARGGAPVRIPGPAMAGPLSGCYPREEPSGRRASGRSGSPSIERSSGRADITARGSGNWSESCGRRTPAADDSSRSCDAAGTVPAARGGKWNAAVAEVVTRRAAAEGARRRRETAGPPGTTTPMTWNDEPVRAMLAEILRGIGWMARSVNRFAHRGISNRSPCKRARDT